LAERLLLAGVMSFALTAGSEPLAGFRATRRLGRSPHSETWLVQSEEGVEHVVKWLPTGGKLPHVKKLTSYRHPFLHLWDKVETRGDELLLLADWSESTLASVMQERTVEPGELFGYLKELAEALDYLHIKHKLVHGRLTPAQVGIQHGHVKLLDWGLFDAESLPHRSWSLTDLQRSAPEVIAGEPEPASDQFALAVLFLEVSTSKLPLDVTTLPQLFQKRLTHNYDHRVVPAHLHGPLNQALAPLPGDRFVTCAAFIKALEKVDLDKIVAPVVVAPVAKVISKPVAETPPVATFAKDPVSNTETSWANSPTASLSSAETSQIPTMMIKSLVEVEKKKDARHPDSAFLNLNTLVYQSKVQSYGILTPTFILGIGKRGRAVLQELSTLFHQSYDGINSLPHVRLMVLDEKKPENVPTYTGKPGELAPEHYYFVEPLNAEVRKKYVSDTDVNQWLPADILNDEVDGLPGHARLSMLKQHDALQEKLKAECKIMLASESLQKSMQHTGLSIRQDLVPACYVVAGLDEPITRGCLADLSYQLRSMIAEAGWGNGNVIGVLFLPESAENQAGTFACLTELNHYTQERFFSANYGLGNDVTHPQAPFDTAFFRKLTDVTKPEHLEVEFQETAYWLFRDISTELGSLRIASRQSTQHHATHGTPWYSHGATVLQSSFEALHDLVKKRLLGSFIRNWLDPRPDVKEQLQSDVEIFKDENFHSAARLLHRFQHMAAIVLGREPSHMIEEWIAPLRKGAAARPPLESLARDIMQKVETNFGSGSGYQYSPILTAIQQESEAVALEASAKIAPFLMQYLDHPSIRLGGVLHAGKHLLDWINNQLNDLQANHMEIHEAMLRAERTLTQMMQQEERSFAIMGRQRLVSQIVQDLSDYPTRVLQEDMFARAVHVFQSLKNAAEECLQKVKPAETTIRELYKQYESSKVSDPNLLLLDGESSVDQRVGTLLEQLPNDVFFKMDNDLTESLTRFRSNYRDVCLGQGPKMSDVLNLLDNSMEEVLEGMLPSEDAAEQLLTQSSQAVVEQLRQSYRQARPDLMENTRSREGAYCLMMTPNSDAGQELLQMAQATLPQIVGAPEGFTGEILFYRETGCLQPNDIYPEGHDAYQMALKQNARQLHSRFDIAYWHRISPADQLHHPRNVDQLEHSDLHHDPISIS
jgi:eukaryotic-like serine/threonine-protein kinase